MRLHEEERVVDAEVLYNVNDSGSEEEWGEISSEISQLSRTNKSVMNVLRPRPVFKKGTSSADGLSTDPPIPKRPRGRPRKDSGNRPAMGFGAEEFVVHSSQVSIIAPLVRQIIYHSLPVNWRLCPLGVAEAPVNWRFF